MEQLHDKITSWLNNRKADFFEGISLLSQLITNRTLIRNLSRKESKYSREKLSHELRKQLRYLPTIITSGDTTETDPGVGSGPISPEDGKDEAPLDLGGADQVPAVDLPPAVPPAGDPPPASFVLPDGDRVALLQEVLAKMHNKKGILSNSLREFAETDNEGRRLVLEQITSINFDMQNIQDKLDFCKEHGKLPEFKEEPAQTPAQNDQLPDDPILLKQRLLNERSTISKLRKKIKDGTTPEKLQEMEAELQQRVDLTNEIQRRIHGAG